MAEHLRFRRRPTVVEAIRWTGSNVAEMRAFAGNHFDTIDPEDRGDDPDNTAQVLDRLHSSWIGLGDGDWVVRDANGVMWPVKADVFAETYEAVDDGLA